MASPELTVEVPDFLQPAKTFDVAGLRVLEYLTAVVPMGLWAVTRVVDGRQILLVVKDRAYGLGPGAEILFTDSPCWAMVSGAAPQIAPDTSAYPAYAGCGVAAHMPLGAYVGTPIVTPDGELFGTVCGFNPGPVPDALRVHQPLLALLSSLLSSVLGADQAVTAARRRLEESQLEADTDALTGLLNRRGWDRYIRREEDRFRRFGDQASVVVMDLDRLKTINDTQGHDAGDRYIRRSADALAAAVRSGDILARLGGDEFGIVILGSTADVITDLVARMEAALNRAGVAGCFGHAPIGIVAGFPGAWKAADAAMYEQKKRRRGADLEDGSRSAS